MKFLILTFALSLSFASIACDGTGSTDPVPEEETLQVVKVVN